MKKSMVLVVIASLLAVALPKGYAEPRDRWSLEARLPASTLALLTIEDVGTMPQRFEKTAIAGLFREPEMQAFVAPIGEAITQKLMAGRGSPLGEATPLVMNLLEQLQGLRGQLAMALVEMDMRAREPRIVASLDFGPHIDDFAQFAERMRMQLDPQGNAIRRFEKDGRTYWQSQAGGPPVTATTIDTAFVIATDPSLLGSVVAKDADQALADDEAFQAVRRRVRAGGDLGLFAYANVPSIVDLFEPMMDPEVHVIATALGLDTVEGAGYGMAFSGDGFMDSFVIHAPGADHGLVRLVEMPAYQPRALQFVPAGAFYYQEASVNVAELLPNIRRLGTGVSPHFADELNGALTHARNMLGVDVEAEVLAGLAGPSAFYAAMPDTGGLFPEVAIFMQVREPGAYERIFDRLARGIAGAVTEEGDVIASTRTITYRDQRLHLFEMQAARGDDVVPFTPTWTLMDDWLVITLVPHAMKEIVLRAASATTGGGLAAQEDFRALRRVMPSDAGEFDYIDLQALLNLLYDTAVPALQTAAKPNVLGRDVPVPLDWAQLPATRTVRPYLRSMGVFTTWNRDGIAMHMHGPIPLVGVMTMATAVAVPMYLRMPGRARRFAEARSEVGPPRPTEPVPSVPKPAAERRACVQVTQLGAYVRVFLLSEDRMPTSLEELVEADVIQGLENDPWGRALRLRVIDEKTRRFTVESAGPDGTFGTDDDIDSGG